MSDNSDQPVGYLPTAKYDLGNPELGPLSGPPGPADMSALAVISLGDVLASSSITAAGEGQVQEHQTDTTDATPPQPAAAGDTENSTEATSGAIAGASNREVLKSSIAEHTAASVKVWVKDPEKVEVSRIGVTFTSYVTYVVRTECSPQVFPNVAETGAASTNGMHVFEVRRRFADFETLHRLLKTHYRGYFLPPLPDKAFLESRFAGEGFLKTRKVDLQAYMRSVANHPALQGNDILQLFLSQPGDLNSCSRWHQLIQQSAPADTLLGLLKQTTQQRSSSANAAGGASGAAVGGGTSNSTTLGVVMRMKHSLLNVVQPKSKLEVPADEQQLQQTKAWFKELQQHLSTCVTVVRSYVGHLESLSADFNELGRSLGHMARYEEQLAQQQGQYTASGSSSTQRAADLQLVAYAALRQQAAEKQFALRSGASLVFLHDWWVLLPEVIACLEEREDAFQAVLVLQDELRDKQLAAARAGAALGPVAGADKKLAALNADIQALTERWAIAHEQYEVHKERNQSELMRLNLQRAVDFRESLQRFAAVQLQLAQAAAEVWKNAVELFSS